MIKINVTMNRIFSKNLSTYFVGCISAVAGACAWAVPVSVPSLPQMTDLIYYPQVAIATVASGWGNSGGEAMQEALARALSQSKFRQYQLHQQVVRLGSVSDSAQALRSAQAQKLSAVLLTSGNRLDRQETNANRQESVCVQRNANASSAKKIFGMDCERSETRTVYCNKLSVRYSLILDLLEVSSGRVRSSKNLEATAEHVNCQASDRDRNPVVKNVEQLSGEVQQEMQKRLQATLISSEQSVDFVLPAADAALTNAGLAERYRTAARFLQENRYDRGCADLLVIAQSAPASSSNLRALGVCDTQSSQFDSAMKRFQQAESLLPAPDKDLGQQVALLTALSATEKNFKRVRSDYVSAPVPSYAASPVISPAASVQAAPVASLAPAPRIEAGHRVALVVGNSAYQYVGPLANPRNDAQDMRAALQRLGFEVVYLQDGNRQQMIQAINQFGSSLKAFTSALVFYAGHGMQVKGENFLIPVDANPKTESEVEIESVNLNRILVKLEKTNINIVVLDACRNDPFKRSWRSTGASGLASVDAPKGTLIAYATSPGNVAEDGQGRNSPYTAALTQMMAQPNLKIEDVFKRVRAQVASSTRNRQVPWESSSLVGDFYFSTQAAPANNPAPAPMPVANTASASNAASLARSSGTTNTAPPAPSAPAPIDKPASPANAVTQQDLAIATPQDQCKDRTNPVSRSICERRVCERNPDWTSKLECSAYKASAQTPVN